MTISDLDQKRWIALFLFAVVTKDLGPECIDFMGDDNKAHTRCSDVIRYTVKGQPDCESQEKSDCAYLYDVAEGLNLLEDRRKANDAICKVLRDKMVNEYGCAAN